MNSQIKPLDFKRACLEKKYWKRLSRLKNPSEIQDFLNRIPFNFEKQGETNMSPALSLEKNTAHCFEGALIAALTLWINGSKPLLLDLKTTEDKDVDHVVALFKENGFWGAISKTNHAVLRYREPVYKTIRELAMSYFHEYFLSSGEKTMRSFSKPFDLSKLGTSWIASTKNLYPIVEKLDKIPHTKILNKKQIKNLRKADKLEIKAGEIKEY
jgi:hypothetical protein